VYTVSVFFPGPNPVHLCLMHYHPFSAVPARKLYRMFHSESSCRRHKFDSWK